MSFSSKAKAELCRLRIKRPCCARAALSAWVHTAGALQLGRGARLRMVTENYAVARWGIQLVKSQYSVETEIYVRERKRLGKDRSFSILLGGDSVPLLLRETGVMTHSGEDISILDEIVPSIVQEDCCKRSFMRGAFMGAGSVSDPQKGYHLEFVMRSEAMAASFCDLLNHYELNAKTVLRKGSYVVYLKESDKITEFLTLIGAFGAILDLENVKAYKDFRNTLNRQVNCETANIQKTASAAARQIENIRFLLAEDELRFQSAELQQTAMARINNPDATLSELGEMLDPPVGKSGINHRLRKLDVLAQQRRSKKEGADHGT